MKRVLIDQPGFMGDIIFVMAIAQKYADDGYIVEFPVFGEHIKISIQKYFPTIKILPTGECPAYHKYHGDRIIDDGEYLYLPLYASGFISHQHMKYKYEMLGFNYNMWRNIKISRDYDAEKKLFNALELKEGDKYNLINEYHQSTFIKIPIFVDNGYKNIYMNKIENYSIFDWIGVMEKAQSIHTIGTALIFIIDALITMPNDLHIYRRLDKGHDSYDYLLNKTYIYH